MVGSLAARRDPGIELMTGVTDTLDAAVDAGCFVRSSGNTVWWGGTERVERFHAEAVGYQVARDAGLDAHVAVAEHNPYMPRRGAPCPSLHASLNFQRDDDTSRFHHK